MSDLDSIQSFNESCKELEHAVKTCVRVVDSYSNVLNNPDALAFDDDEVEEAFHSIPDEDSVRLQSEFEEIGYFPSDFPESGPVEAVDWLNGIAQCFTEELPCYISYAPLADSGMVILQANLKQSQGCRAVDCSISVNASGEVQVAGKYYTHREVYRMKPVSNTIRFLNHGTTDETIPFESFDYEEVVHNAHAAVLFDPYARSIADKTFAAYKPTLVTLLVDAGLTHEEIGWLTESSRSTVSSQAQDFRELHDDLREYKDKITRTESLVDGELADRIEIGLGDRA